MYYFYTSITTSKYKFDLNKKRIYNLNQTSNSSNTSFSKYILLIQSLLYLLKNKE